MRGILNNRNKNKNKKLVSRTISISNLEKKMVFLPKALRLNNFKIKMKGKK